MVPELRFSEFKNDEEWGIKMFGEICEIKKGEQLNRDGLTETGHYPCMNGGVNPSGFTEKYNSKENTITISEGGNSCGYVNFIRTKFWLGGHCYKIILKGEANLLYLYQLLKFNEEKIMRLRVGSGLPNIQQKELLNFNLVTTKNLAEQQKIADCLSSLDDIITVENLKLETLQLHKKGLMQHLFPSDGEKVPKLRFREFKDNRDWVVAIIDKIASISSGGTPSRSEDKYWNGNIPWVSTTLIDFNKIERVNEFITESGLANSSTKMFPKGTILMAMYGQGKTRGKVAILGLEATINQACGAITLNEGMNTMFVFQNLAGRYDEIRSISNQGGQENLSAELIKKIRFSYPDIKSGEQQKIADCLSSLDDLIAAQNQKVETLKAHKKGLMQQLFPNVNEI